MATGSYHPGEFAQARRRVGYVLDRFHAARDIEPRIIESPSPQPTLTMRSIFDSRPYAIQNLQRPAPTGAIARHKRSL
jgi:hypothetical protein